MSPWWVLLLLSAVAATGEALRCITCSSVASDSCGILSRENCPDGHVCASQYRTTKSGGFVMQFFDRICAPQSECQVTGTYTHKSTSERIATTCCSSDLCSPAKPKLPAVNSMEPNGLMCSTCIKRDLFCDPD
ncbi:hypothetical protein GDO81_024263 [Engystomops pustulosus]|uniref:UPAR/Ly6 domain-containing protein n=1 Tax=Engystomops pustulosus TaxID=76066 RepID=A0AAV6ZHA0_ENGPU|nr:hypothetical protein GDO81_024263 [Engystomops pustulosus]